MEKEKSSNKILIILLFILVLGLVGYITYDKVLKKNVDTPVEEKKEEGQKTEENSVVDQELVQDLYSLVKTEIDEEKDYVLNDQMKLYLAYRQIPISEVYNTHCSGFEASFPFVCETTSSLASFQPRGFKSASLQKQLKKLFGKNTSIANQPIKGEGAFGLSTYYDYVAARDEYVQGENRGGGMDPTVVTKTLVNSYKKDQSIYLEETVKYTTQDGSQVSDNYSKHDGTYQYQFNLEDGHYIYVSKTKIS